MPMFTPRRPRRLLSFALVFAAAYLAALILPAHASDSKNLALVSVKRGSDKEPVEFVIELYPQAAPGTVENFKKLVRRGFYKGLHIHRVVPNFLIQMGDPRSTKLKRRDIGTNGPGYTIPSEANNLKVEEGAVVMARLPDDINPTQRSNGSQFFIALDRMSSLDGNHTVFGRVVSGMEAVRSLSMTQRDTNAMPSVPLKIRRIRLIDSGEVPVPEVDDSAEGEPAPAPSGPQADPQRTIDAIFVE